jgi:hypothetical protein
MSIVLFVIHTKYYSVDQIRENEMGQAHDMYGF